MKKVKYILLMILLLVSTACGKTEDDLAVIAVKEYLATYQELSETTVGPLTFLIDVNEEWDISNKEIYIEAIKRQYEDLTYKIETVNKYSNTAIASVTITVYDLNATKEEFEYYVENEADPYDFYDANEGFNESVYYQVMFTRMLNEEDRVSYNIVLELVESNGKWEVRQPNDETMEKIQGLYVPKEEEETEE